MDTALLIIGAQRSGTTLLNRIVDAHPQIALLYQQSNFLRLDPAGLGTEAKIITAEARKVDSVYTTRFTDEIEARIVSELPATVQPGAVYRAVIRTLSRNQHSVYWGEKYAGRCLDALKFVDVAPDGRIIHIVRDPRDVCASEKRRQEAEKMPTDARPYLLMLYDWKIGLFIGDYLARLFPNRYHRLRYEDLVSQPEQAAKGICRFLGLDFSPAMLDAEKFRDDDGKEWEANSYFFSGVKTLSDFRGRWKQHLSTEDVIFVEDFCAEGMAKMGYRRQMSNIWSRYRNRKVLAQMAEQAEVLARLYINDPAYKAYSPANASEPIVLSRASPIYEAPASSP